MKVSRAHLAGVQGALRLLGDLDLALPTENRPPGTHGGENGGGDRGGAARLDQHHLCPGLSLPVIQFGDLGRVISWGK